MVAEATGLPVNLFLSHEHGGIEQIGQRIIYNEIDMVLFFNYPKDTDMDDSVMYISRLCDEHSVPLATNVATAELLIHGLARGDLDWREVMNPNRHNEPVKIEGIVCGVAEGCRQAGCALVGGETAEMPGMYEGGEYDIAGFTVGVVERSRLIDGSKVKTGDVLVGIAS